MPQFTGMPKDLQVVLKESSFDSREKSRTSIVV
jgi:hypothetical protein